MTTPTEAMRLALDALEYHTAQTRPIDRTDAAITALRDALSAAPQPPAAQQGEAVAWKHDCAALLANDLELWIDRCPHCGKPRAQPAAAPQPVAQGDDLLEIARRTGLRQRLHGVNATDARALLKAFLAAAAPAGVVGEPVARVVRLPGRYSNPKVEWIDGAAVRIGMELFAAPPARQALTDEQIVSFANEAFDTTTDLDDETLVNKYGHGIYITRYLDFARAIEHHHGIGGKEPTND